MGARKHQEEELLGQEFELFLRIIELMEKADLKALQATVSGMSDGVIAENKVHVDALLANIGHVQAAKDAITATDAEFYGIETKS